MAAAALTIDINARLASLEQGLKDANKSFSDFGRNAEAGAKRASAGFDGIRGQFDGMANSSRRSALQVQQVSYQLQDFFVQVTSGQSPVTAFIQQGSQLSGTFGGFGAAIKGVLSIFTPLNVAIGGAVATVGALAYAWHEGRAESELFNQSLLLTGNYAGLTEGRFNALAKQLAGETNQHIGATRDVLQELISTGQFAGPVLENIGAASLNFARASGQSAEDVVKDFAKMDDGVAKWASEHNRHYHFLSAAQYDYIRTLEEQGQKEKAEIEVLDALNGRFDGQAQKLGFLQQTWKEFGDEASHTWDVLKSFGRDSTLDDQIAKLENDLAAAQTRTNARRIAGGAVDDSGPSEDQSGEEALAIQKKIDFKRQAQAGFSHLVELNSQKQRDQETLIAHGDFFKKLEEQTRSNAEKRSKEIAEINEKADFDLAHGAEFSADRRAKLIAAVNAKYKDSAIPKGRADHEAGKLLDAQLKELEIQIKAEDEAFAGRNQKLDLLNKQNLISFDDYYAALHASSEQHLQAESAVIDKEIAAHKAAMASKDATPGDRAKEQAAIDVLLQKQGSLQSTLDKADESNAVRRQEREQQYANTLSGLNVQVLELGGNLAEAAGIKFDTANAELIERLTVEHNASALEQLGILRNEQVAQAKLNELALKENDIRDASETTRLHIDIGARKGTLTGSDSLVAESAMNSRLADQLRVIYNEKLAIYEQSKKNNDEAGDPRQLQELHQLGLEIEDLRSKTDLLGDSIRTNMQGAFSDSFTSFLDGTKTAKEAFADFGKSVAHDINSMVSKDLAKSLFGGTESLGGQAAGWLGNLFGGSASASGQAGSAVGELASNGAEIGGGGLGDSLKSLFSGFGGGGKKGDTEGNPLFVKDVSLAGSTGTHGAAALGDALGSGDSWLQGFGKTIGNSLFGSAVSAVGGNIGNDISGKAGAGGIGGHAIDNYNFTVNTTGPMAIDTSVLGKLPADFPKFAGGGFTKPGWFMAGEKGPELIRLKSTASFYDNRATQKLLGQDGATGSLQQRYKAVSEQAAKASKPGEYIDQAIAKSGLAGIASSSRKAPGWIMAGEHGPELIRTTSGAKVFSNSDTKAVLGGLKMGDLDHPIFRSVDEQLIKILAHEASGASVVPAKTGAIHPEHVQRFQEQAARLSEDPLGLLNLFQKNKRAFAEGGDAPGGWFMAGERGPELIRTNAGAKVYNNSQTKNMTRGGDTHHYIINVQAEAGMSHQTAMQRGAEIGRQIDIARRNR